MALEIETQQEEEKEKEEAYFPTSTLADGERQITSPPLSPKLINSLLSLISRPLSFWERVYESTLLGTEPLSQKCAVFWHVRALISGSPGSI